MHREGLSTKPNRISFLLQLLGHIFIRYAIIIVQLVGKTWKKLDSSKDAFDDAKIVLGTTSVPIFHQEQNAVIRKLEQKLAKARSSSKYTS